MGGWRRRATDGDAGVAATFVVLVGAAYLSLLGGSPAGLAPGRVLLGVGAGLAYPALGTRGFAVVARLGELGPVLAYFALQIALGTSIVALFEGQGLIVLLTVPLAGQAARVLPDRWVAVVCALLVASIVVPVGVDVGWLQAVRTGIGLCAVVTFFVVYSRVAANERRARAELALANRRLRDYAAQVEDLATVQERNRLAREIHDGLGHYLTVINMQVQAARAVLDTDRDRAAATLAKAQTLSQEALADVRRSVAALRAGPAEGKPLPAALAALAEESEAAGLPTRLAVTGTPRPLPPPVEQCLYRAAQEGLTNARKHAAAGRANLALAYGDGTVGLEVRDDGRGAARTDGGFGLVGLRERVHLLGGTLRVETAPGRGLRLGVEVPG